MITLHGGFDPLPHAAGTNDLQRPDAPAELPVQHEERQPAEVVTMQVGTST